jgi:hypothetical protein
MGYTTSFSGSIELNRKLTMAEAKDILNITSNETGIDAYFQWVPAETLQHIVWDGEEKFYQYVEQLRWLCEWLADRDILANGILFWQGEDTGDTGTIQVIANQAIAVPNQKLAKSPKPLTLRSLQEMALEQITSK